MAPLIHLSASNVAWKQTRGLPYVPSPLYYRGHVYLVKDGGMVSCYDAKTGAPAYQQERLNALGNYYASPVAADGRVIVVDEVEDPYLKRPARRVRLFMNVFNVHSNRTPVAGEVKERWYNPGSFFNAALDKASGDNRRSAPGSPARPCFFSGKVGQWLSTSSR